MLISNTHEHDAPNEKNVIYTVTRKDGSEPSRLAASVFDLIGDVGGCRNSFESWVESLGEEGLSVEYDEDNILVYASRESISRVQIAKFEGGDWAVYDHKNVFSFTDENLRTLYLFENEAEVKHVGTYVVFDEHGHSSKPMTSKDKAFSVAKREKEKTAGSVYVAKVVARVESVLVHNVKEYSDGNQVEGCFCCNSDPCKNYTRRMV